MTKSMVSFRGSKRQDHLRVIADILIDKLYWEKETETATKITLMIFNNKSSVGMKP